MPSDAEIDAALWRLVTLASSAKASPRRAWPQTTARRIAVGGTVTFSAAVAAFAAVNLLPASPTPGAVSSAWAKQVIAHAAAALTGSRSGILHVGETQTVDTPGAHGQPDTIKSWESQAPYRYWVTEHQGSSFYETTVKSGDRMEQYISSPVLGVHHHPVHVLYVIHAPEFSQRAFGPLTGPAYKAALALVTDRSSSSTRPENFSDLIVHLLRAPGVRVNTDASVNGTTAISITAKSKIWHDEHDTLYLRPKTYTPLELTTTSGTGAAYSTTTTTFSTYETLPADSVSMPNLEQLYPSARVLHITAHHSTRR